jgi:type II secretory pathway pseudopilin PulG
MIKNINRIRSKRLEAGFTMIEVIIYISLVSFITTMLFSASFLFSESNQKTMQALTIETTGAYILRTLEYELSLPANPMFPITDPAAANIKINSELIGTGTLTTISFLLNTTEFSVTKYVIN